MNEQELARKIVQRLDRGLSEIKQGTLYQLQSARGAALQRYREVPESVAAFAWASNATLRFGGKWYFGARYLVAAAFLVLALVGVTYWQVIPPARDLAEIDASLLAGELPINAYLDSDFEAWLKRSSQ